MVDEPNAPAVAAPDPQSSGAMVSSNGGITSGTQAASAGDNPEGGRPEWLPEGVNSVDELPDYFRKQEAGAKVEAQVADPLVKPARDEAPKGEDEAAKPGVRTDDEIKAGLKEKGGIYADPKYEPYALAFEKNGDLTAEERTKAATDFGVPQAFIDSWVEQSKELRTATTAAKASAQQSSEMLTAQLRTERLAIVGGEDQFKEFNTWATENLTKGQLDAYNSAPNEDTARELLSSYADKWKRAGNGPGARDATEGKAVEDTSGRSGVKPYESQAEQLADQGSQKYKTDPAFRNAVQQRIAISNY